MVTVKKDTINRLKFENEMADLKSLVRKTGDPEIVVKAIDNITHRLIEYTPKKGEDPFPIPKWMNTVADENI